MDLVLEAIQEILASVQGPLSNLITMFPGTIITFSLFSIIIRRRILETMYKFKK